MVPKLLNFALSQLQRSESWRKKKGFFFIWARTKLVVEKEILQTIDNPYIERKLKIFSFLFDLKGLLL
jgi:hypothetical protein